MNIRILTIFPEMIEGAVSHSIVGRACKNGLVSIKAVNIRDFAFNKHNSVDDYPYGGGAGMVMAAPPIVRCHEAVVSEINSGEAVKTLYMSPQGKRFDQSMALELSQLQNMIIICGHYEGIDERAIELTDAVEVSLGDFVLTGGEIAAIAITDSVTRLIDGVLSEESHQDESFSNGLLEYPQYTRPPEFMGKTVPQVLLSGNHGEIAKWRHEQSILRTKIKRKDMI